VPAEPSSTHVVLIPSYNTGDRVLQTVREALEHWAPVWVIVDGSDDGSGQKLDALAESEPQLRVLRFARNRGKGSVLLDGAREALERGFDYVLTMDADGQHSAAHIAPLMKRSLERPEAAILGKPVFDESAPRVRVHGRKLSNGLAAIETLGGGIGDALFGMRVYPAARLVEAMESTRFARRFDFEPEMAVRLAWDQVEMVNVDVPVRYLSQEEGGVSHFNYLRDNLLLSWMNLRLLLGSLWRLPRLIRNRRLRRLLDDPDSRLSIDRARMRVAGRFPTHWFRSYSRSKIKSDPLFERAVEELRPLGGKVVDFGCGQGALAFYLKERGFEGEILGIDRDEARIAAARRLAERYYPGVSFEVGDVREGEIAVRGHGVISDVLQYLTAAEQDAALKAAATCVPEGGRLLVRTAIRDASLRFRFQRVADVLALLVRWIRARTRHYPSEARLITALEPTGLRLRGPLEPQWGSSPLNLYLAVFERPAAEEDSTPPDSDPSAER
jgi:glycosyltransferase involved in cell wall biosynthesis